MPAACSSPLLPIAGHGHPLPWLPSLCVGWWVGVHCRITPGSYQPVLSSTVTAHSQDGPQHAQSQECWQEPQHLPCCKPRLIQCQTRAAHLTPSSRWPNCKSPSWGLPQATSSTRASPQPPERWHLPTAAPSALLVGPSPKPNQPPHH